MALAVHLYTAAGGIIAFFTLLAAAKGRMAQAFFLLFVSTIIDYSDGTIARRIGVREVLPNIEGDKLDSIIDYINNSLLPAYILWLSGRLPRPVELWACLIMVAGLLRYSTIDGPRIDKGLFCGLPTPWLFVAFYFYYASLSNTLMGVIIIVITVLLFLPIEYIHIARFGRLTGLSIGLLTLWWLAYLVVSQEWTEMRQLWLMLSLLFPGYYLLTPLWIRKHGKL